jgi:hypothetical protein
MHKEKICKFQSFASTGDPKLGPKRLEALQDQIAKRNLDGFLFHAPILSEVSM